MSRILIALPLVLLAACSSEPPACTKQSFFYNDIPGCKEAVAKWKAENPEAAKRFEAAQAEEGRKLEQELLKSILGKN